jgi:hypothetical protein
MINDCKIVNENYKNQKKDEKEKTNWMSINEIKNKYDGLLAQVKSIFKKTMIGDSSIIIQYLLIALLGGVSGVPPRRSLDYADMKIRNYDKAKDNYYKSGRLFFNKYKTAKTYGLQTLDVPREIDSIIKKWIKINPTDYLLHSSNNNKLSSPQITRMLNKIFGKNVSTDMLRHIYLSEVYKDVPALKDMEQLSKDMAHGLNTALTYIKRD